MMGRCFIVLVSNRENERRINRKYGGDEEDTSLGG